MKLFDIIVGLQMMLTIARVLWYWLSKRSGTYYL